MLFQSWYGLSDYEVEDRLNDNISFSYFRGIHIDVVAQEHSTLSGFRGSLTKTQAFEKLFDSINAQLEAHNTIVKSGIIVDASVVDTSLRTKGKTNYKVTEDRTEEIGCGYKRECR